MAFNNYLYHVFIHDASGITELESYGFTMGKVSTDGNLVVCDKQDDVEETITDEPSKPAYVVEDMTNWPHLSNEEAIQLVTYEATEQGGSDGYSFNTKGV